MDQINQFPAYTSVISWRTVGKEDYSIFPLIPEVSVETSIQTASKKKVE